MALEFTKINIFKSNSKIGLDPDLQVAELVKYLEGKIKSNWQVLAPSPNERIFYFEMEDGAKPELVDGYQKHLRDLALGEKQRKPRKKRIE
jgi:hypothetical protein